MARPTAFGPDPIAPLPIRRYATGPRLNATRARLVAVGRGCVVQIGAGDAHFRGVVSRIPAMRILALVLLAPLLLTGCPPVLYTPTPALTPGIDQPGQVRASAHFATPAGGHAQAAVVVLPHGGVWGAGTYVADHSSDLATARKYRRQQLYEGGVFASGEIGDGFRIEGIAGLGRGQTQDLGSTCCLGPADVYFVETDLTRVSGQVNVSREWRSGFTLGYTARVAHLDIRKTGAFDGYTGSVLDHGAYLRTGGPLGFEMQFLSNVPLTPLDDRDVQFDDFALSLGLSWHLPRR